MGDKRTIYIGREKITFDDEISKTLTDEYGITPNMENNDGDNAVTWPWRKGESSLLFPGNTTLHDEHIITPYPAHGLLFRTTETGKEEMLPRKSLNHSFTNSFINSFINGDR